MRPSEFRMGFLTSGGPGLDSETGPLFLVDGAVMRGGTDPVAGRPASDLSKRRATVTLNIL